MFEELHLRKLLVTFCVIIYTVIFGLENCECKDQLRMYPETGECYAGSCHVIS